MNPLSELVGRENEKKYEKNFVQLLVENKKVATSKSRDCRMLTYINQIILSSGFSEEQLIAALILYYTKKEQRVSSAV